MKDKKSLINFETDALKDGFTANEAYFVELEANLFEQLNIEEKLLSIETDGFDVEPSTLDKLEDRIPLENKVEPHAGKIKQLFVQYGQWAAVLVVIIGCLGIFKMTQSSISTRAIDADDFTKELSEVYLQEQVYFLTDLELETMIQHVPLEEKSIDFSEKELEDYLMINEAYNLN